MKDEDARITKEIRDWFKKAKETDDAEDRRYGEEAPATSCPKNCDRRRAAPSDP